MPLLPTALMKPLSGNSSDPQAFGQVIHAYINQSQTTYGATYLVADSVLYSEANLDKLAQTAIKWITRVPATVRDAQVSLAHADPSAAGSSSTPRPASLRRSAQSTSRAAS